jgi:predicted permease
MSASSLLRSIGRARGIAVMTVATIALGSGALVTTLGVADASLWRSPPFRDASRVVLLFNTLESPTGAMQRQRWSYPRIQLLRRDVRSLDQVANFTPTTLSLTGTELTEPLKGEVVSPLYFPVLGVLPLIGRTFAADEDRTEGEHPIAVLSYDLWQRRFAGDPNALGRTIALNQQPVTIIGVMPQGFRGISDEAQLWVPTTMAPLLTYPEYLTTDQNFISVVSRVPDNGSLEAVRAELATLGATIARALPSEDDEPGFTLSASATPLTTARVAPEMRRTVWLLLGAVVLLHLLACANVTSLLMGRAVSQRREAAVRASLGSTTGALYRRYVGEGAAMIALGCGFGLLVAWWASHVDVPLNAWGPRNFYGSIATFSEPHFGWRWMVAWLAVSAGTIALVAWAPALTAVRGDLAAHLREGSQAARASGLSLRRVNARGVIVALESALATVLLVVGTLMISSFARMRATPLGVDPAHVLTFSLGPPEVAVPPEAAPAYIEKMLAAITAVPGVVSASVDGGAPLSGSASSTLHVIGRPDPARGQAPPILRHYVGPDHFTTLGVPLIRGRAFTDRDRAGQPRVAVISETAARTFWPEGNALGARVWFGGGSNFSHPDSSAEVVGIVGDVMYQPLDREANRSSFYTPYQQFTYGWRTYFVRTTGDPSLVVNSIRGAVHAVDANVPLTEVVTLNALIGSSWSRNRFDAFFYGAFAVLALVLAATGIYAVVSYAVSQRGREMAIRLAVGSSPAALLRLVVREGMGFPVVGLVAGVAGALSLTGLLRGSLYGVLPSDPRFIGFALVVLGIVALLACAVPARKAMQINPQDALRAD